MKLFIDVFAGDELISDAYNCEIPEGYENVIWYVKGKKITKTIGEINIGGNPSAGGGEGGEEDGDEGVADEAQQVIDIVDAFKLQEFAQDKKSFTAWLKGFSKKTLEHLKDRKPDRVEAFQKGIQAWAKDALKNFDNFVNFYYGESMNIDEGILVPMFYKDGEVDPIFIYFPDAMRAEKC
eukprot:tig00000310_g23969.t1